MQLLFKYIVITVTLMLVSSALLSQKQVTTSQQIWTGFFNQTRFSEKWGMWADFHVRTKEEFVTNLAQAIGRVGITYYVNDNTKLTAGYAYVNHFPSDNHKNISQPEHRPWQQIQWHSRFAKMRMMQWVRLEERFRRKIQSDDALADGYNFNYKVRYNMFVAFPLSKRAFAPGTLSLVLNDELHVNFGKEILYNSFDQNRLFAGFALHTNSHDNLQFGYMNLFQQLAAGNKYRNLHTIRIFYFHNLDLRSPKSGNH